MTFDINSLVLQRSVERWAMLLEAILRAQYEFHLKRGTVTGAEIILSGDLYTVISDFYECDLVSLAGMPIKSDRQGYGQITIRIPNDPLSV